MRSRSEAPPLTGELGGNGGEGGSGVDGGEPSRDQCTTDGGGGETSAHSAPADVRLPCQNSHKSIVAVEFPPSARRTAFALQLNVHAMCERHGVERVGFLTLTFADHVLDAREAQRRLNSLNTNVLKPRYGNVIRVIERQKSGRIHYHLLVALGADIRTGVDFAAFERRDYRTAPEALRREWAFWRATARKYGFGRTELLPIRRTSEAIGRYVGKYVAKHLDSREERDKRVRLVSYSGERIASTRFAWVGGNASSWRAKLKAFVWMLYESGALSEPTTEAMARRFGPRWAWKWRDSIVTFPEEEVSRGDDRGTEERETAGAVASVSPSQFAADAGRGARASPEASARCGCGNLTCAASAVAVDSSWHRIADGFVDISTGEVRLCGVV